MKLFRTIRLIYRYFLLAWGVFLSLSFVATKVGLAQAVDSPPPGPGLQPGHTTIPAPLKPQGTISILGPEPTLLLPPEMPQPNPNTTYFCGSKDRFQGLNISLSTDFNQINWQGKVVFETTYFTLFSENVSSSSQNGQQIIRSNPTLNAPASLVFYQEPLKLLSKGDCKKRVTRNNTRTVLYYAYADQLAYFNTSKDISIILQSHVSLSNADQSILLSGNNLELHFDKNQRITQVWAREPLRIKNISDNIEIVVDQAYFNALDQKIYLIGPLKVYYLDRLVLSAKKMVLDMHDKTFTGNWIEALSNF